MDSEKRAERTERKTRKAGAASARDEAPTPREGTTTLDRVHIAMLLQKFGKSNALRTMLKSEIDRGPDFLRLANALSRKPTYRQPRFIQSSKRPKSRARCWSRGLKWRPPSLNLSTESISERTA